MCPFCAACGDARSYRASLGLNGTPQQTAWQRGLTYFSSDPQQAEAYASGFAPWQFLPTPSHPAVVVAVRNRGGQVVNPRYPTELGVRGNVPTSDIVDVYVGKPIIIRAGRMEVVSGSGRPPTEGSRMSPSVRLRWERAGAVHDREVRWTKGEHGQFTGSRGAAARLSS